MNKLLLSIVLIGFALAANGVDLISYANADQFLCLMQQYKISYARIIGYKSFGAVDPNIKTIIDAAKIGQIDYVDIIMKFCRSKSASVQANQLINYLGEARYYNIWIDITPNNSPGCSWSDYSYQENCDYIGQLITAIQNKQKNPGIFSNKYAWAQILGSVGACYQYSDIPLWYSDYDGYKNYDNFEGFGGWSKPASKQYTASASICGIQANLDWYEQC